METNTTAEPGNLADRYGNNKHSPYPQPQSQPPAHYNTLGSSAATVLPSPLEILSSMIPPMPPPPGTALMGHPHARLNSVYPSYIVTPIPGRLPAPSQVVMLPPPQQ